MIEHFYKALNDMSISDWIEVIGIISSFLLSAVALWQSRKSIKLTEESIHDANRPYISIYTESIDTIYFSKHIALKNFGNTSAKIINIDMASDQDEKFKGDFSSLIGGSIAPNQKFTTALPTKFKNRLCFKISYQDLSGTIYTEIFNVKTDMTNSQLWASNESQKDSQEATAIKKAAHAIIKAFK